MTYLTNLTGAALGTCYNLALTHGAPLGLLLNHAFICGAAPSHSSVQQAISEAKDIQSQVLGNIHYPEEREKIVDLEAYIIFKDVVRSSHHSYQWE